MSRANVLMQCNNLYGEAHEIGNANGIAGVAEKVVFEVAMSQFSDNKHLGARSCTDTVQLHNVRVLQLSHKANFLEE